MAAVRVRLPPAPWFRLTVEEPVWTLMAPSCSLVAAAALPVRVKVPPARFRAVPLPRRLLTLVAVSSTSSVPPGLTVKPVTFGGGAGGVDRDLAAVVDDHGAGAEAVGGLSITVPPLTVSVPVKCVGCARVEDQLARRWRWCRRGVLFSVRLPAPVMAPLICRVAPARLPRPVGVPPKVLTVSVWPLLMVSRWPWRCPGIRVTASGWASMVPEVVDGHGVVEGDGAVAWCPATGCRRRW